MKFLGFLLLFTLSHAVELIDPFANIREKCQEQLDLSERELEALNNDLLESGPYFLCFARTLGVINDEGDFDVDLTVKKLQPVTPPIVSKPLIECCFNKVLSAFAGERYDDDVTFERIVFFVSCCKARMSDEMWNVMGVLGKPIYSQLDDCCD